MAAAHRTLGLQKSAKSMHIAVSPSYLASSCTARANFDPAASVFVVCGVALVRQVKAHCNHLQIQVTWWPIPPAGASAAVADHCACGSTPAANAKGLTMSDSPGAVTAAAAAGSALELPGSSAVQNSGHDWVVACSHA